MSTGHGHVATTLLRCLTPLYRFAVGARNRHYDRPANVQHASLPVISVGNITAGGTGKTPMVAWLAHRLQSEGRKPAVVSRGYGGSAGKGPLVVSEGDGPRCSARQAGDEPCLLARTLPGVVVVVGSDRVAGAAAAAASGADVVLLDDGFQHRRLARDLDIVLLDGGNPFDNDLLLPAGLLREPLAGLARADVVVITRCTPDERPAGIEQAVRAHNRRAPLLRAGHRREGFFDRSGRAVETPRRAVAFCGIGNPARFRRDLEAEGVELVAFEAYRDHHVYRDSDLTRLDETATSREAVLVTTEKDLARLGPRDDDGNGADLLTLRIATVVYDPGPLERAVDEALAATPAAGARGGRDTAGEAG